MNDVSAIKRRDLVVLVHGLGRSSIVFWRMTPYLRHAGFDVETYDYPSTKHNVAALTKMLIADLGRWADGGRKVHMVGHSMGGILIRGALLEPPPFDLGRIVMIGSPNKGAGVLNRMGHRPFTSWYFGPAAQDLAVGSDYLAGLGVPKGEIGVIAGTTRWHLLNPIAYVNKFLAPDVPNDGTVEVENTYLEGMTDFIALPANHTIMCQHPRVMHQVLAFLLDGGFDHGHRYEVSPARQRRKASQG